MKKKEKKEFDSRLIHLLGVGVEVQVREKAPETFDDMALGGVWDEPEIKENGAVIFKMWVKPRASDVSIVHECYHCFMIAMSFMDSRVHYFRELYEEVYAYTFSVFYNDVRWVISEMLGKKDTRAKQ